MPKVGLTVRCPKCREKEDATGGKKESPLRASSKDIVRTGAVQLKGKLIQMLHLSCDHTWWTLALIAREKPLLVKRPPWGDPGGSGGF
jgi:hypothetical protein